MTRQRNVGKQPIYGTYVRAWPCACGKRGYPNRDDAKKVIKEMRRQGKIRDAAARISAYRCATDPDYWHVGHDASKGPNVNDPRTRFLDEETT